MELKNKAPFPHYWTYGLISIVTGLDDFKHSASVLMDATRRLIEDLFQSQPPLNAVQINERMRHVVCQQLGVPESDARIPRRVFDDTRLLPDGRGWFPERWSHSFLDAMREYFDPHQLQDLVNCDRVNWVSAGAVTHTPVDEVTYHRLEQCLLAWIETAAPELAGSGGTEYPQFYIPYQDYLKLFPQSTHTAATQETAMNDDKNTDSKYPLHWSPSFIEKYLEGEDNAAHLAAALAFDRTQWEGDNGEGVAERVYNERSYELVAHLNRQFSGYEPWADNAYVPYAEFGMQSKGDEESVKPTAAGGDRSPPIPSHSEPNFMKRTTSETQRATAAAEMPLDQLKRRPLVFNEQLLETISDEPLTTEERQELADRSTRMLEGVRVIEKIRSDLLQIGGILELIMRAKRNHGDKGLEALYGPYGSVSPATARRLLKGREVLPSASSEVALKEILVALTQGATDLARSIEALCSGEVVVIEEEPAVDDGQDADADPTA